MKRALIGFLAVLAASFLTNVRAEGGLVTELERDHVDITTHFNGDQIIFFGALSRPGDVVIKVVSPSQSVALSEKKHLGPVWVDGGRVVVRETPGLLYLASTKPIDQILSPTERERYGLSLDHAVRLGKYDGDGLRGWEDAFVRLKKVKDYYREQTDGVTLVKDKLFFTHLQLPAKLPEGAYELHAYLVKDGKVVAEQTHTLNVQQVSIERWVSNVAHVQPWMYGFVFTVFCMGLGLGLSMLLRRDKDD